MVARFLRGGAMNSPHDRKDVCIAPLGPGHADELSRPIQRVREPYCGASSVSAKTNWIAGGFIGSGGPSREGNRHAETDTPCYRFERCAWVDGRFDTPCC